MVNKSVSHPNIQRLNDRVYFDTKKEKDVFVEEMFSVARDLLRRKKIQVSYERIAWYIGITTVPNSLYITKAELRNADRRLEKKYAKK